MANSNEKPYVFVSYAHADKEVVMPTINAMKAHGINLWYDGGIEAGSEWPEYIAEKVISCSRFILFISDAYLRSQNCKRELNFAISRKKEILSIYLHDVELSPGMEMQLGTYQAFFRNRFATNELFFAALCKEHFFDNCLIKDTESTQEAAAGGNSAGTQSQPQPQPGPNNSGYAGGYNNQGYGSTSQGNNGYRNDIPYVPKSQRGNQGYNGGYNNQNNGGYSNGGTYRPPSNQGTQGYNGGYSNPPQTPPTYRPQPTPNPVYDVNNSNRPLKSRIVAAVLALLFGSFGIQRFYLGQYGWGILYIIFFWTYIPGIISFFEAITLFASSDEKFEQRYKCRTK